MNRHRFYNRYKRNKEAAAFYNTTAWKRCREIVLIRDNYLCQGCLRNGKITPANTVHHIKHLEDHPELALDIDNLESICPPCHNKEHPEKGTNDNPRQNKSKIKIIKNKANKDVT